MNELEPIFNELKTLLRVYSPPYTSKQETGSVYDLWSIKNITIEGRKRKEVFFASVIIQKSYVGFYFMPVYAEQEIAKVFAPELLKLKKGMSCFHIKNLTPELTEHIRTALRIGHDLYVQRGWV